MKIKNRTTTLYKGSLDKRHYQGFLALIIEDYPFNVGYLVFCSLFFFRQTFFKKIKLTFKKSG